MYINEAIKLMEKGKKVRRKCWVENDYWFINLDTDIIKKSLGNSIKKPVVSHKEIIKSFDWDDFELYDPSETKNSKNIHKESKGE